jgi:glycosyltransferase involved in cell wall biosynthesis
MHICMIMSTPFPPEEGIGYYAYNLSKKLVERGNSVTIITRGGAFKTYSTKEEGISIIYVPYIPLYPLHIFYHGIFVNKVLDQIGDEIDIIHVHTPLAPYIKTNKPIISTVHTSVLEDAKSIEVKDIRAFGYQMQANYVSRPVISHLIDQSQVVTTVANSVAEEIKRYYSFADAMVLANGVNQSEFHPIANKDDGYILSVGRLDFRKGLLDLIDCAQIVCKNHKIEFKIVGKGPLEKSISKRIDELGLNKQVTLLGHVDREQLISLYQNARLFVLPSHYEGLPTVLLEAMASGLPVVATNVSGCIDVIQDRENGILIPPKEPRRMADAITTLLSNPDLSKTLGKNARDTINAKYTWDSITRMYEECYRKVLQGE